MTLIRFKLERKQKSQNYNIPNSKVWSNLIKYIVNGKLKKME